MEGGALVSLDLYFTVLILVTLNTCLTRDKYVDYNHCNYYNYNYNDFNTTLTSTISTFVTLMTAS